MSRGLKVAEPPRRRGESDIKGPSNDKRKTGEGRAAPKKVASIPEKFSQIQEGEKVQFNKRVTRGVADGYEMLAIKTRKKVPELLAEALDLLEDRYGKT